VVELLVEVLFEFSGRSSSKVSLDGFRSSPDGVGFMFRSGIAVPFRGERQAAGIIPP
jgi:hypothetical protein